MFKHIDKHSLNTSNHIKPRRGFRVSLFATATILALFSFFIVSLPEASAHLEETSDNSSSVETNRYTASLIEARQVLDVNQLSNNSEIVPSVVLSTGGYRLHSILAERFAASISAPVILVSKDGVTEEITELLNSYNIMAVYIIGKSSFISDADLEKVRSMDGMRGVMRIAADRYTAQMSVNLAKRAGNPGPWCGSDNPSDKAIFVIAKVNFIDSEMVKKPSAVLNIPIFVTSSTRIPPPVVNYIADNKITTAVVIGGEDVIPTLVDELLISLPSVKNVVRLGGENRGETALDIVNALGTCLTNEMQAMEVVAAEMSPEIMGPMVVMNFENNALTHVGTYNTISSISSSEPTSWKLSGPDASAFSFVSADKSSVGDLSFVSVPDYRNPIDENKDNVYEVILTATNEKMPVLSGHMHISINVVSTPDALTISLREDTGISTDDGITNDATVDVGSLAVEATWEYSVDSGANFVPGANASFELAEGSYAAGSVLVRQIWNGVPSSTTSLEAVTVDTTPPVLDQTTLTLPDNLVAGRQNTYTFFYNEPVFDIDTNDIMSLDNTIAINTVSVDGSAITITYVPINTGTVILNIVSDRVSDTAGNSTSYIDWPVSVSGVATANTPPRITNGVEFTHSENSNNRVAYLEATDDEGDSFTFWSIGGADSHFLGVNNSGTFNFSDVPSYQAAVDADRNNVYELTVAVVDEYGAISTFDLRVQLTNSSGNTPIIDPLPPLPPPGTFYPPNTPPVITSSGEITYQEGSSLQIINLIADDGPYGYRSWKTAGGIDNHLMDLSRSGELRFKAPVDYNNPQDSNMDNIYEITAVVRDADGSADILNIMVEVVEGQN